MFCHVRKPSIRVVCASAVAALLLVTGIHTADAGQPNDAVGQIAFASERSGDDDIWVMDADGDNQTRILALGPISDVHQPIWSPDGTRIGFLNLNTQPTDDDPDDDDTTRVWVADADGTNLAQLTRFSSYVSTMTWSGDGSRIAFDDSADGAIWTVNSDGTDPAILIANPNGDCCLDHPAWSPDGSRIAFLKDYADEPEGLWTVNADGTGATKLTERPVDTPHNPYGGGPAWSPDGTRIAFTSWDTDRFDIRVMNADGTGDIWQLATVPAGDYIGDLEWSPDGTTIAWTTYTDGHRSISVVDTDGTDGTAPVTMTGDLDDSGSPSWSPDGTHIAFESTRTGDPEIWVMDADGTNPVQLTDSPGFDGGPAWRPEAPEQPPTTPPTTPPTQPSDPDGPDGPDRPAEEPRDRGHRGPRHRDRFDYWGSWEPRWNGRSGGYSYLSPMLGRYDDSFGF